MELQTLKYMEAVYSNNGDLYRILRVAYINFKNYQYIPDANQNAL